MIARMLVQCLTWMAVVAGLLLWPAGRLDWVQAWVFVAIVAVSNLAIGFWLVRHDPGLLAERMKPVGLSETKPLNRIAMTGLLIAFHAWFVAMGFAARRPTVWPVWAQVVGALMICACMLIAWRVFRENSFAAPVVRTQADRGQRVVTTGPYALVRHPMYAGAALWMFGTPLLIGGPRDLAVAAAVMAVIVLRALGEERMLRRELPGYGDYMAKVRFRLLPGVW